MSDFCRLSRIATKYLVQMPQVRMMLMQRRKVLEAQDIVKYKELIMRGKELKDKINEDIKYLLASFYSHEEDCTDDFIKVFERSCEAFEKEEEVAKLELEKSKMMINVRVKEAEALENAGGSPRSVALVRPRELG